MAFKRTLDDIPELAGYMTVAAIATKYGMHKTSVQYIIMNTEGLPDGSVVKVTKGSDTLDSGDHKRALLLVRTDEVEQLFARRAHKAMSAQLAAARAEWNLRVKQWGLDTGWNETPIFPTGAPNRRLVNAYREQHPNDPQPE